MTRRFSAEAIPAAQIDELCDLARRAPSAGFSQGTHFVILDGESLARFWTTSGAGAWFDARQPGVVEAPVVVLAIADPAAYTDRYGHEDKAGYGLDQAEGWDVPFWIADTAMAVQQLLLLAEDRQLGALYFGVFRNRAEVLAAFGVPPDKVIVGAVALGRRAADDAPSGTPQKRPRRPVEQVIHRGQWLR